MQDKKLATITGRNHVYEVFREPTRLYYLLVDGKGKFSKIGDDGKKNEAKKRVFNGSLLIEMISKMEAKSNG